MDVRVPVTRIHFVFLIGASEYYVWNLPSTATTGFAFFSRNFTTNAAITGRGSRHIKGAESPRLPGSRCSRFSAS